jgi:hypothetical protein
MLLGATTNMALITTIIIMWPLSALVAILVTIRIISPHSNSHLVAGPHLNFQPEQEKVLVAHNTPSGQLAL